MVLRARSIVLLAFAVAVSWAAATAAPRSSKPVTRATPVVADTVGDSSRLSVKIQRLSVKDRPIRDTLLLTIRSSDVPIAGFNFKVATTSPYVRIANVLKGEILDSCKWDYFNAREIPVAPGSSRPANCWRIVGMAQSITPGSKPKCFGFDREASLVKLVVSNSHVLQMPETTAAVFFIWEDCADNVVSGPSGEQLYMSVNVLDYFPVDFAEAEGTFPTHKGALRQCVNPRSRNKPKRIVEFHNGGVEWRVGMKTADSSALKK